MADGAQRGEVAGSVLIVDDAETPVRLQHHGRDLLDPTDATVADRLVDFGPGQPFGGDRRIQITAVLDEQARLRPNQSLEFTRPNGRARDGPLQPRQHYER